MRLKLISGPAVEPISLEETKNYLRVDGGQDNALISALIVAARQLAEKETHRAFITQTWTMTLDKAEEVIEVPKPPLQVDGFSIKVIDSADAEIDVDSLTYYVDASENSLGRVQLKSGSWPSHRGFASFIITFKAGYGLAGSDVPDALRQGILKVVATFYEERQAGILTKEHRAFFAPYKIYRI